jgi:hypothetical protein
MSSNLSLLAQLAGDIASNAAVLDEYLTRNNLQQPGFDANAPAVFQVPDEAASKARAALADAGKKLSELMQTPAESVRFGGLSVRL